MPQESVGRCSYPCSRPWAHRWRTTNVWRVASVTPYLQLPSQPQGITAHWLVPNYTAWWQGHMSVNNLPRVALDSGAAGIRTRGILVTSPALCCYALIISVKNWQILFVIEIHFVLNSLSVLNVFVVKWKLWWFLLLNWMWKWYILYVSGCSWEPVNRRWHFTKVLDWLGWEYTKIPSSSAGASVQPLLEGVWICMCMCNLKYSLKM